MLALGGCEPASSPPSRGDAGRSQSASAAVAELGDVAASAEVRGIADWAVASKDHGSLPFAVVDKNEAHAYVFSAEGRLVGDSPVLLGLAHGDAVVPGIGKRALADVGPDDRRTPAGRFASVPGHTTGGDRVVWLNYDEGIAMHTIVTNVPAEERQRRMASGDPAEHRISYGCINFPPPFFAEVLAPALVRGAIVYVLPDTESMTQVFPMSG